MCLSCSQLGMNVNMVVCGLLAKWRAFSGTYVDTPTNRWIKTKEWERRGSKAVVEFKRNEDSDAFDAFQLLIFGHL